MKSYIYMFILVGYSNWFYANQIQTLADAVEKLEGSKINLYHDSASLLRCPTCTGLSVLESDAGFSLQIRSKVVELVGRGFDQQKILDFFTSRYGVWILRKPPFSGFHSLAWLLPVGFIFLGAFCIWFLFWKRKKNIVYVRHQVDSNIIKEMTKKLKSLQN
jgi:cytochrome c-type biogenesis protein CcmH/NrfF